MIEDVEFGYDAKVSQIGLITVSIPSHFVAVLVAEKLGLPMPARNSQCEVRAVSDGETEEGDHMVNIDFEYLARVDSAPVTLTVPGRANETKPAAA